MSDCDAVSDILPRPKNLTHPIHTIPPEILSQILYHVCCSNRDFQSSLSADDPRWALSYVSRSWREVVVSSPELWSVFHINLRKDRILSLELAVTRRAFDLFMKRSGQHPLDMIISTRGTRRPHLDDNVRYVMSYLCSQATRWRRVTFLLSHTDDIAETMVMLSTACSEFPLLLEIAFGVDPFGVNSDDVPAELKFPFPAPRLRRGKFDSVFMEGLPWEQLTELALARTVTTPALVETCLNVLASAQHLDSLHISEEAFGSEFFPSNPRIVTIPSVHTLCIDGILFLQHLSLPNLVNLHIVDDVRDTISATVNLFLSRSGCVLTSIYLWQRLRGQDIPLILSSKSCMYTLTCLIIKGSYSPVFMSSEGAAEICTLLSRIGADADFLPSLEDAAVDFDMKEDDLADIMFWDVLEERARTMRSFEVVVHSMIISANGYVPPDNAADMDGRYWPMTIFQLYHGRAWDGIEKMMKDSGMRACLSIVRMWKSRMGRVLEDRNVRSDRPSFDFNSVKSCTYCWDCQVYKGVL